MNHAQDRYSGLTRFFHWGMALLIVWQLLKFFDRIAEGEHWVGQALVPWHLSIGTLLLVLIVLRIIRAVRRRGLEPAAPGNAFMVKTGHGALYAGMLLMPITGILTMVGNGYGLTAFGVQLIAQGEEVAWMASLGGLHSPVAWLLLVLIVGHIAMALIHQFVKKDGVLQRMV